MVLNNIVYFAHRDEISCFTGKYMKITWWLIYKYDILNLAFKGNLNPALMIGHTIPDAFLVVSRFPPIIFIIISVLN